MRPDLFEEKLIKEVQKYGCLYHKELISSLNNDTERANAWTVVASTVGATEQQCKDRWHRLRERYIKVITKVCYDPEFKSIWRYSEAMSFIKEHLDLNSNSLESAAPQVSNNDLYSREMFEERLIEEVKKYQCLYNIAHPDNRATDKDKAWSAVASAVSSTVQQCRHRWKSLKLVYIRCILRINADTEYACHWKYMDTMSFMKEHLDLKPNICPEVPECDFEEKLIEEVQKYVCIYNNVHPDHRRRSILAVVWSSIASVVGRTAQQCKARWKFLRARYIKEYLQITSENDSKKEYISNWKYNDAMSFMKDYVSPKPSGLEATCEISKRDMFCRTCMRQVLNDSAEQSSKTYNIFQTIDLGEKLMDCSNLQITSGDDYPHSVCEKCYVKVLDFYKFQKMCRDSLNRFNEMQPDQVEVNGEIDLEESLEKVPNNSKYFDKILETEAEIGSANYLEKISDDDPLDEHINSDSDLEEEREFLGKKKESSEKLHNNSKYFDKILETEAEIKSVNYLEKISDDDPLDEHINSEEYEFLVKKKSCDREVGINSNETANVKISNLEENHLDENDDKFKDFSDDEEIRIKMKSCGQEAGIHYDETANVKRTKLDKNKLDDYDDKFQDFSDDEEVLSDISTSSVFQEKAKRNRKLKFKCDICSKYFYFQQRLEAHLRRHQGLYGYPCTYENCKRGFNRLIDLKHHLNNHTGIANAYKCCKDNCDKVYTTLTDLRNHRREKHKSGSDELKFICEECGKCLTNHRSLKQHRLVHVDKSQWPYVCDVEGCTKRFRTQTKLRIHKKRHAGIKNYICPHCGVRKITRAELNVHINTHTLERTFACPSCPKVFKSMAARSGHVRVYHKNELYWCRFCDRSFINSNSKLCHERIHTGERPYECKECGKTFIQSGALKVHMNMHIKGEKPHACRECGRRFAWPMSLKSHMKLHLEAKPYTCEECGNGFRWPGAFARHKKMHLKKKMANAEKEEEDSPAKQDKVDTLSVESELLECET